MSEAPRWRARMTSPWLAAIILALFYAALLLSLREKSATLDEPGHATAGYAYWKFNDYRLDPENGNLPQRLIALPLVSDRFRFPDKDDLAWKKADIDSLAGRWFYDLGNDTEAMLLRGRAASALLAVGTGLVIWLWSRRTFGPAGGMLSLGLYVLNPGVLANGGLMTSDMASAFFLLLSLFCFWSMLQRPTPGWIAASASALGALFVAKMSAVIMIPVALLLAVARVIDSRPMAVAWFRRPLGSAPQRAVALAAIAVVHVGAVVLIVWLCYGFRFSGFPRESRSVIQFSWNEVLAKNLPDKAIDPTHANSPTPALSLPMRLADFARRHELLPEAFIYGYAHVWKSTDERIAFLNGELRRNEGWLLFFPYTILVKTPLALFGVIALAFVAMGRRRHEPGTVTPNAILSAEALPLLLFMGIYLAAAMKSNINIGHRHILPIYPPLFVLCGAAASWIELMARSGDTGDRRRWRVFEPALLGVLVAVSLIETACWFPNYLAYFNGIVRPSHAYRHLIDSSLDWGQDLPALRKYIDERHPPAPLYLAQFGRGPRPDHYGIKAIQLLNGISLPLVIVQHVSLATHKSLIEDFLRHHPEYDGRFVATLPDAGGDNSVVLRRADVLRLQAGTYFISASEVQPIYPHALGPWNPNYEATYQKLKAEMAPFVSDDLNQRALALQKHSPTEWLSNFQAYDEFRFARLTADLRKREPDELINYSILVYHLTDADLARALDGPPPYP